jgi:hypothetical protein
LSVHSASAQREVSKGPHRYVAERLKVALRGRGHKPELALLEGRLRPGQGLRRVGPRGTYD